MFATLFNYTFLLSELYLLRNKKLRGGWSSAIMITNIKKLLFTLSQVQLEKE